MTYHEIEGNLITLAQEGTFDVIAHGCNCFCTMGAGIAPQIARAFGCHVFPMEHESFRGDINKLGTIDYEETLISPIYKALPGFDKHQPDFGGKLLTIVNCYTQFGPGFSHRKEATHPLSYPALIMCLQKLNYTFPGKHIGLPQIGCGLAGGNWDDVKGLIQKYLTDMDVTVVMYKPKEDGSTNTRTA